MTPSTPEEYFQHAKTLQSSNQLTAALHALEQGAALLEHNQLSVLAFNIYYHIGLYYTEVEKYDNAVEGFKRAIQYCPEDRLLWLPYYGWGFALSNADRLVEAIEPFSLVLRYCEEVMPLYLTHLELGDASFEQGDFKQLIYHYKTAFELAKQHQMEEEMLRTARELGDIYLEFEQGEEAVALLGFCLDYSKQQALSAWERLFLGNLSTAYLGNGQLELAKQLSETLLEIGETSGVIDDKTTAFNNLAMYYRAKGNYHKGIELLKNAIGLEDNQLSKAIEYRNLSRFYEEVGDWSTATYYLLEALAIVEKEKNWEKVVKYRFQAGDLYFTRENYPLAIQYYESCLAAFEHYPENDATVEVLSCIGSSWSRLDEFEKGLEFIHRALEKADAIGASERTLGIVYDTLGGIYLREDMFEEARMFYQKSRELDEDPEDIITVFNYAAFHYMTGDYEQAEIILNQAIQLFEHQRFGLGDFDRKLYDNQFGYLYEYLAAIKAHKGDNVAALDAIELLKSRAILEEEKTNQQTFDLDRLMKCLKPDEAVVYFVNTLHNSPLVFCISNEAVKAEFLPLTRLRELIAAFENKIDRYFQRMLQDHGESYTYAKASIPHPGWFDLVMLYYRHRLEQPPHFLSTKKKKTEELARIIYAYLFQPIIKDLEGKSKLTIIPDRSLSLIPFETLINEKGQFLVELFSVAYMPNLSLAEMLKKRRYQFQRDGLGVGISNYEPLEVEETIELESIEELPLLRMRVKEALQNEIKLDGYYQAVGVYNWPTLACVLDELSHFQEYLNDTLTFQNITPNWLLKQSIKGSLRNNRIIHFAVHGIAIPAIPELSSLVLLADVSGNRYANADTIAGLDIEADLVVLSACETGLGEIIPSIGSVGLTQSFLSAGSKSVLVSLWEIDDHLTATLIRCFYAELSLTSWDYALALANTKRKCLSGELGEELKNPLYWAAIIWFGTFTDPQ